MKRWNAPNGYRDVLNISLPLVASMGSITLMQFTDRMFLANYSVDAIAAALPGGIASFTTISFFMGVASYTNTFVAQYSGAGALDRVGAALWQGIYFSLVSAVVLAGLVFAAGPLFDLIGHSPHIRALEVSYFSILTLGAGLVVLGSAMAAFFTGRGLTRVVMVVHVTGAVVNIPLDYCLINGAGPFPELGIEGAAVATVTAYAFIVLFLGVLIFGRRNRTGFGTWPRRAFDRDLFGRLMRYGAPSGVQFFLEIFAIGFFVQMLGRLGDLELATSNIVLSIETLSFLPMVGFHIGNATLVGQAVGRARPQDGAYATTSALHITFVYMGAVAALFVGAPQFLLGLFKAGHHTAAEYAGIMALGVPLMRFVALYCFFDALNLVFSGALKGAGDTRFIMWAIGILATGVMIIPVYTAVEVFGAGVYTVWVLATLYICGLGVAFLLRYLHGNWKRMRVIESAAVPGEGPLHPEPGFPRDS
ncbi:MAG: MATE family efflux transporter [Deltaproteobacteria bacterium]|nr:MATE family efflux transporter [Deltaproteobacteria bacterium]